MTKPLVSLAVSRFEHYGMMRTYTHRAVIPQLTA